MIFSGYTPSSETVGFYGRFIPSFLRNLYTVLHNGCINLYYQQQFRRVLFCPHHSSTYCLQVFLMMALLAAVRWYLIVLLIYISPTVRDVEHLFMCLLAICMSSLEKSLFSSLAHFLDWVIYFSGIELHELLVYFWDSLSVASFAIIFSHSEGCLFTLIIVSFVMQKLLILIRSHHTEK